MRSISPFPDSPAVDPDNPGGMYPSGAKNTKNGIPATGKVRLFGIDGRYDWPADE